MLENELIDGLKNEFFVTKSLIVTEKDALKDTNEVYLKRCLFYCAINKGNLLIFDLTPVIFENIKFVENSN